jgi:hypothetical protein
MMSWSINFVDVGQSIETGAGVAMIRVIAISLGLPMPPLISE